MNIILNVVDTSGLDDYKEIRFQCYNGADVVLVWFNVTSPASYNNILSKVGVLLNHRNSHDIVKANYLLAHLSTKCSR